MRWWRGIHPQVLRGGGGLDPRMVPPLLVSVTAIVFLAVLLIRERLHLSNTVDHVDRIAAALEDEES